MPVLTLPTQAAITRSTSPAPIIWSMLMLEMGATRVRGPMPWRMTSWAEA